MADYKKSKSKDKNFDGAIGLPEGQDWSKTDLANVKAFIKEKASNRTPDQKVRNEFLSIRFQMEDYIENREIDQKKYIALETFLGLYLTTLRLSFNKFAIYMDTTDGNLKKYLTGSRKFNTDLAMKFGHFFHTEPDLWLKIQLKNELIQLNSEKRLAKHYEKYDYEKMLELK